MTRWPSVAITLAARRHTLACASAIVALKIDGDGLGEVVAEVAHVFLCECLSCDDCGALIN
jgi:hypothetical protein